MNRVVTSVREEVENLFNSTCHFVYRPPVREEVLNLVILRIPRPDIFAS
jgi:hypothetical protein